MDTKYSRIELLALIKAYNKQNNDKIKNADKLKKKELIVVCASYGIIFDDNITSCIDLRNVSKKDLLRDVELFFLKQNKQIPSDVLVMKKKELIGYMELNQINHYTLDDLKAELNKYQRYNDLKNIIIFNILKYDNVDIEKLDDDNLELYIKENSLDTNIEHLQAYSKLVHNVYVAFEQFCKDTRNSTEIHKIKSIPGALRLLSSISQI